MLLEEWKSSKQSIQYIFLRENEWPYTFWWSAYNAFVYVGNVRYKKLAFQLMIISPSKVSNDYVVGGWSKVIKTASRYIHTTKIKIEIIWFPLQSMPV